MFKKYLPKWFQYSGIINYSSYKLIPEFWKLLYIYQLLFLNFELFQFAPESGGQFDRFMHLLSN